MNGPDGPLNGPGDGLAAPSPALGALDEVLRAALALESERLVESTDASIRTTS